MSSILILGSMNTKMKGDRTESFVLAALLKAGYSVSTPFGENQRYDLIADYDGKLLRIQCKTGRVRNGVVVFNTASVHAHRGKESRSYRGQIELFGVYCPDNSKIYLVPVGDVPENRGYLRLNKPKNGQTKGVLFADQYEFM